MEQPTQSASWTIEPAKLDDIIRKCRPGPKTKFHLLGCIIHWFMMIEGWKGQSSTLATREAYSTIPTKVWKVEDTKITGHYTNDIHGFAKLVLQSEGDKIKATLMNIATNRWKVMTFGPEVTKLISKNLKSVHRIDLIIDRIKKFLNSQPIKQEDHWGLSL